MFLQRTDWPTDRPHRAVDRILTCVMLSSQLHEFHLHQGCSISFTGPIQKHFHEIKFRGRTKSNKLLQNISPWSEMNFPKSIISTKKIFFWWRGNVKNCSNCSKLGTCITLNLIGSCKCHTQCLTYNSVCLRSKFFRLTDTF